VLGTATTIIFLDSRNIMEMLTDKLLINIHRIVRVLIMTIEDKDILQVDGTVSIGVLILLTLTGFTKIHGLQFIGAVAVIIPFGISAILIIFGNLGNNRDFKKPALLFMAAGFVYLIAIVVLISGLSR
jgi:hypothetical protein